MIEKNSSRERSLYLYMLLLSRDTLAKRKLDRARFLYLLKTVGRRRHRLALADDAFDFADSQLEIGDSIFLAIRLPSLIRSAKDVDL